MKNAVVAVLFGLGGMVTGIGVVAHALSKQIEESERILSEEIERNKQYREISDKFNMLFLLMNQCVRVKQGGGRLSDYFIDNNYTNIAIYGLSHIGETLLEELKASPVKVSYAIDKNASNLCANIDILMPNDELKPVDIIVVTAISYYEDIKKELEKKIECPIVSLSDIVRKM